MQKNIALLTQFFQDAMHKIAKSSFYRSSLEHKYKHSIDVCRTGQNIIKNTPELEKQSAEFKQLAECALLFHDVGRFAEAVKLYEDAQKNITVAAASDKYDHGILGYEILKNLPNFNDIRILLAVKYHGKMMENIKASDLWQETFKLVDKVGAAARQILFLVRDADKLANLSSIKNEYILEKDNFFHQLSSEALKAPVSAKVWAQFKAHQVVFFSDVYSFADRIMLVLSWVYDFNFAYSRQIFFKHGYADFLLGELARYGVDNAQIDEIRNDFSYITC